MGETGGGGDDWGVGVDEQTRMGYDNRITDSLHRAE